MFLERRFAWATVIALSLWAGNAQGQPAKPLTDPLQFGPYNGFFLPDGPGLTRTIPDARDPILLANAAWSIYCWVKPAEPTGSLQLVAGIGSPTAEHSRYLAIDSSKLMLWMGGGNEISGPALLPPTEWHLIAATFDGATARISLDGKTVAAGPITPFHIAPSLLMAPSAQPGISRHFGGHVASFTVLRRALSEAEARQLSLAPPNFAMAEFEEASKPWPLQTRGQTGYRAPQDPATIPHSRAPFSQPVAIKRPSPGPSLTPTSAGEWTLSEGWTLREAPRVNTDGAHLSTAAFNAATWMRATVPGTVLTTMIDDGVYADPDYGLNNLAIPESLNKQDYWYRNEFTVPASALSANSRAELTFQGINYAASIWLNGKLLGTMKGAFRRGTFDVTSSLKPGKKNVLAVRISPPPHPGIPQEQSILAGPGENGGSMELDGPTFLATEGWDWMPAIRDRDSGIWQPVTLHITRSLKLGDAQVITSFHNHDTTQAAIEVTVPVTNLSSTPLRATLVASIEQVTVRKTVTLPHGDSIVKLTPAEFPQLNLQHPRLWWPNGYGNPELYHLKLAAQTGSAISDTKDVRFGIREITYELSLLDSTGHLRRVEYSPTAARGIPVPVVDVSHEGMREIPLPEAEAASLPLSLSEDRRATTYSHVASLAAGAESSPAIQPLSDSRAAPYLVLRVNGVRIAARGGNWGMDDARKRVSRTHLEPFFRLHRDAGLNIIRNWLGQSTEETFYNLADEYGMLVWNDFWESTQNYNIEAEDPALFLANAADTIQHFRNHPSIALWCGRNEGVPQPILNLGLDNLVRTLDGTRYYSPSSNAVNLQGSGPYRYQDPAQYYTRLNRGFSVETGTPSMSTLESFQSAIAKQDQWPIGDAWAYHDWHQSGNGDVAPFMAEIATEFGAPTSLEDFERKAQMLNYVDHRAIFEGMNANLWSPNSGRLLWMTQPAWPSTMWQILSSDYDTQASYYGVKKACEPLHIQLNLANYHVDIVNTTTTPRTALTVSARIYSLANALLAQATDRKDVAADSAVPSLQLNLSPFLDKGMVLVALELRDSAGALVSQNLYWLGARPSSYRELTRLAPTQLKAVATATTAADSVHLTVQLTNSAAVASLENKLTLIDAQTKARILPAYYSDNYLSLLPGETRTVEIEYPANAAAGRAALTLRGWNAIPQIVIPK
ncbi:MAG TPA: LamG-like jellyroll fold domain-containing protein [Acidobacteriaceae bacterium]